ncbi:hypothetical protein [Fulvivirga sp.]|uniref:hypothetical protein n=1 Tax=Fulvivirga sp. TaxID=1931237 RepID=UPI0032ED5B79
MGKRANKIERLKIFTAETGKLQMLIPIEWEYKNPSLYKTDKKAPESFGQYEKMLGAFQISCKEVNEHISGIIAANKLNAQSSDKDKLDFLEKLVVAEKSHNYMWLCAVDDHFILVTYIVNTRQHNFKRGILEFKQVRDALVTIKFIKPQFRDIVIAQNRYTLFMSSIAATIDLRNRALENGSFIEFIILTANHIDALLRSAIVLTNQLEQGNSDIDTTVLFQNETDKPIMEKEIYKRVMDRNIIDKKLFDELTVLYNERNKVVHRYIITDIRTEDILRIASTYDELDDKVWALTSSLEKKQFEQKIGLYGKGIEPGTESKDELKIKLQYQLRDKHGRIKLPERRKETGDI